MAIHFNSLVILSIKSKEYGMRKLGCFLGFILLMVNIIPLQAQIMVQDTMDYRLRKEAYIDHGIAINGSYETVLKAFYGQTVDTTEIRRWLNDIQQSMNADFTIIKAVRFLYFTNGEYDGIMLPIMKSIPYWLSQNEALRVYWSENHMIMWMSSQWLLKEKYGWEADPDLRKRLVHYLDLKLEYGYYEFFSTDYLPFTLSGLLNLVDFCEDAEIREKAGLCAQKLLRNLLLITTNDGVLYPAAGRNYHSFYTAPYGNNYNDLIYLLTGLGPMPNRPSSAGIFLATTGLDVSPLLNDRRETLDTLVHIGHPISKANTIHQDMNAIDATIFKWSCGGYFHPSIATQSIWMIDRLKLWNHGEFASYSMFQGIPHWLAKTASNVAASISKSSVISEENVYLFKNRSVALYTVQDFWKGSVGYQQFTWMATCGTTAIYARTGSPEDGWENGHALSANTHLPYVQQKENVALIMYNANDDLSLFGYDNWTVYLKWEQAKFDETDTFENWLIGRQGDNYIAVRRHCIGETNYPSCEETKGQTWVCIVGNSTMYNSFDHFKGVIEDAVFQSRWYFDNWKRKWVYASSVKTDGKELKYDWYDKFGIVGMNANRISDKAPVTMAYPNPCTDRVFIDDRNGATYQILNMQGQLLQSGIISESGIDMSKHARGMYILRIEYEGVYSVTQVNKE